MSQRKHQMMRVHPEFTRLVDDIILFKEGEMQEKNGMHYKLTRPEITRMWAQEAREKRYVDIRRFFR